MEGKLLSVVIILYSESWLQNGINLPCQELAADGLVVVTVAYRLHILSFFTLNTIAARGNLALLDQYMAFIWVKENIEAFGGDPSSITLLGHSAGADSVLLHIASPRAIGTLKFFMMYSNVCKSEHYIMQIFKSTVRIYLELTRYILKSIVKLKLHITFCTRRDHLKDLMINDLKLHAEADPTFVATLHR